MGSNNLNLLRPIGQFGTRLQGGKDAGSARYINTYLSAIAPAVFPKDDVAVLKWREDDGATVEPWHFLPVVPMVLVNSANGIGTGFSTQVPCYDPRDLVDRLLTLLDADPEDPDATALAPLHPWYRGFKGRIVQTNAGAEGVPAKYVSVGCFERVSAAKARITELPVGTWTEDYKGFIEAHVDAAADIKAVDPEYTDEVARFLVTFASPEALQKRMEAGPDGFSVFEHEFKLVASKGLSTGNMYLFDAGGRIVKYASAVDILRAFFPVRLQGYRDRRAKQIATLEDELVVLGAKQRFVAGVIDDTVRIMKVARADVVAQLLQQGFPAGRDGDAEDGGRYDYLLNMPAHSFTTERVQALLRQIADLQQQLEALRNTTPQDMWRGELAKLREEYSTLLCGRR